MTTQRLQSILENVGLTRREAKIYILILEHPETSPADIARISKVPRMTCYAILEDLVEKGFVDTIIKRRRRYFVAIPPKRILEQKTDSLDEFKRALPRLEKRIRIVRDAPRTHFFEGKEGIHHLFLRILQERRPFTVVTSIEDMERIARDYFEDFIRRRIERHIPVRMLTNRTPASMRFKGRDMKELRMTRFVPREYDFHTSIYTVGNIVGMISMRNNPPTALLIEDADIAKTHRMYFDLLWNQAEIA